jgi:hypothetical protein
MKTADIAIFAAYLDRRADRDQAARLRPQLIAPEDDRQVRSHFCSLSQYCGVKRIKIQ